MPDFSSNLKIIIIIILLFLLGGSAFYFFQRSPEPPLKLSEESSKIKLGNMKLTSPAFENNQLIPKKYTCDGKDINPPLQISEVPAGTKTLVLIVDDPDAPMGTWVHWVVWNISPETTLIEENSVPQGSIQGVNDFNKNSYGGPCPPSGTHRYYFKLYALNTELSLSSSARKEDVEKAMEGAILEKAELIGLYRR